MEHITTVTVQEWDEQVEAGEFLTASKAGELLGVSKETVYQMRRRGDLAAVRHPSGRTFDGVRYRRAHIMLTQPPPTS